MLYFNKTNMLVYMYGILIEPQSIYKLSNSGKFFQSVRDNIKSIELLKILNDVVIDVHKKNKSLSLDISESVVVDEIRIDNLKGIHDVLINNKLYKPCDLLSSLNYNKDNLLVINNNNEFNLGIVG